MVTNGRHLSRSERHGRVQESAPPAERSFAGTAAAVAYNSRKSPPAGKNDFRALAKMQTEDSGTAHQMQQQIFPSSASMGPVGQFHWQAMIKRQFDHAFAPFPTQAFCQ